MRQIGLLCLVLFAALQFSGEQISSHRDLASTRTPAKTVSCVYNATDLPSPIIGYGSDQHAARADASHKCFDVRMDLYESSMGANSQYDMDKGYAVANACTNIHCSSK